MTVNRKDILAGTLFVACGAFFCVRALLDLPIGTTSRMGSGYFPLMLGIILIALGATVGLKAIGKPNVSLGDISWRAVALVIAAPLIFASTVDGLGFAASGGLAIFVSAMASRRMNVGLAVILSTGLVVFCLLVFKVGLGLPLKTFGPWLGG